MEFGEFVEVVFTSIVIWRQQEGRRLKYARTGAACLGGADNGAQVQHMMAITKERIQQNEETNQEKPRGVHHEMIVHIEKRIVQMKLN